MNTDILKGKWKQLTGSVKEKWGDLTDDDLDRIDGNRDQLEGKLQERYGYAKDEAKTQVDDYLREQDRAGAELAEDRRFERPVV